MKCLLAIPLLGLCAFSHDRPVSSRLPTAATHARSFLNFSNEGGSDRMSATVFKSQDYCRAELKDFDFDAHFSVVSVTVYFTGKYFPDMETGTLTSSSLAPVKPLMARCGPGSIVVFDDVKVKGPDNLIRSIPGLTLMLY